MTTTSTNLGLTLFNSTTDATSQSFLQYRTAVAGTGATSNFQKIDALFGVIKVDTVNGRVGIGTTSPSTILEVNGLISIPTQYSFSDPKGFRVGTTANFASYIQHAASAQYDTSFLHNAYVTSASTIEAFKWDTTHANFGSRGISFQFQAGIVFYADSVATTAGTTFTPTPRMTIANGGNVGIGTMSPQSKLDIISGTPNSYANRTSYISFHRSNLLTSYENRITNSMSDTEANTTMNFELTNTAGTGYVVPLSLNGTGNVGVGTEFPTAKLHVVGLVDYANNAAAVSAGLTTGAFYTETGTNPKRVCVVT